MSKMYVSKVVVGEIRNGKRYGIDIVDYLMWQGSKTDVVRDSKRWLFEQMKNGGIKIDENRVSVCLKEFIKKNPNYICYVELEWQIDDGYGVEDFDSIEQYYIEDENVMKLDLKSGKITKCNK